MKERNKEKENGERIVLKKDRAQCDRRNIYKFLSIFFSLFIFHFLPSRQCICCILDATKILSEQLHPQLIKFLIYHFISKYLFDFSFSGFPSFFFKQRRYEYI